MTHSDLLIAAGALLTFVLAALVFTPTVSAEERRLRDVQRLLRALEAQRRVRDAKRRRETRPAVRRVEPVPVAVQDDRAECRAFEKQRRQEEKEQRNAEKRARRQAEQERKAELATERARAEPEPEPEPALVMDVADEPKPLTELPLFSWASRIESEERPQR